MPLANCRFRKLTSKLIFIVISWLITGMFVCLAQPQSSTTSSTTQIQPADSDILLTMQSTDEQTSASKPAAPNDKTKWRLETSGSYTNVTNNYGNWYGGEIRLTYTGSKLFTPTLSAGSQTRPQGTQQAYGLGSYVNFGKYAYALVGVGFAPDHGTILFPNFRYDVMAFAKPPKVKGLIMTAGYSSYRMGGGNSKSFSVGSIYYYRKVILNGAIAFNRSYPGSLPSKSGYFSIMTGRQGRYWFGAGASGGDLNYQLIGIIPFNVHYNGYGFSAFFQKWLQKHWGITERYYFTNLMTAYKSNSVSVSLFYEF